MPLETALHLWLNLSVDTFRKLRDVECIIEIFLIVNFLLLFYRKDFTLRMPSFISMSTFIELSYFSWYLNPLTFFIFRILRKIQKTSSETFLTSFLEPYARVILYQIKVNRININNFMRIFHLEANLS